MKRVLVGILICLAVVLVVVLISTSAFATTATTEAGNILLSNPFMRLWNAIHNLQTRMTNITLTPGPEGPPGPVGECNCTGTGEVSLADFQSLVLRVDRLEGNNLPDCILDTDCDDNNVCTDEVCDAVIGCVYSNNNDACDDGDPNTINDVCSAGVCTSGINSGGGTGGGELIVTEIMYNPNAVLDTAGEWFEIHNPTASAINLNGWSIMDDSSDYFIVSADLFVQPGDYVVLCKNSDVALNGGVLCDIEYNSITLGNTADSIILVNSDSIMSDEVQYDASLEPWKSLNQAGYSLQLDPSYYTAADNDDAYNWCNPFEPLSSGDYGTPGGVNSDCNFG